MNLSVTRETKQGDFRFGRRGSLPQHKASLINSKLSHINGKLGIGDSAAGQPPTRGSQIRPRGQPPTTQTQTQPHHKLSHINSKLSHIKTNPAISIWQAWFCVFVGASPYFGSVSSLERAPARECGEGLKPNRSRPYKPSINWMFCTAAPLAPLPRLSRRAISTA